MNKLITLEDIIRIVNISLNDKNITINQVDNDLTLLGMDSISFIRTTILLEEEFGLEIPDSYLLMDKMNTINKIYDVLTIIRGN